MSKKFATLLLATMLILSATGTTNTYAEEVAIDADLPQTTSAENAAPIPQADTDTMADTITSKSEAQLKEQADYDEAVASITDLNKRQALEAAINSVDTQIANFNTWKDIPYAISQIKGQVNNLGQTAWEHPGSTGSSVYIALETAIDGDNTKGDDGTLAADAFRKLINRGLADARYNTDEAFKEIVDESAQVYNYGRAALEQTIPKLNSNYTEYILKSKTDAELIQIAEQLPETVAYTAHADYYTYHAQHRELGNSLCGAYNYAMLTLFYSNPEIYGGEIESTSQIAEDQISDYGYLVAAAKRINPDFTVDLSDVEILTPAVEAPAAPNSGSLFANGDGSAQLVTIILSGIIVTASLAGIAFTAKRYLFSPLKRRK